MKPLPLATACLFLLPCVSSCGGGGKKSSEPPDPPVLPNAAPVLTVPSGLSGNSPRYTFALPIAGTQTLTFTAIDPDGDPLLWQIGVDGNAAMAAGLAYTTPATGSTFALEVLPAIAPTSVQMSLLVEDPRGSAAAIDLLVVRTGPPSITSVAPSSAFRNRAQQVTIHGSALQLSGTALTTVGFDGFAATGLVVDNDTTVRCSTPTSAALGGTIVGVATQYGVATLPEAAFTMLEFPPSLAANDQRLDNNTVSAFQLAVHGLVAHAVWLQGNTVMSRRSDDGGATWSAEENLSGVQVASEPQVLAGDSVTTVAWIAGGSEVWIARRPDNIGSFLPAQRLDTGAPGTITRRPRLAQGGSHIYAAWLAGDAGLGQARVVATASSDSGDTWVLPTVVNDGLANQSSHELACDGAVAWVVFEDERLGANLRGIYAVRTANSGGSWGSARRLNLNTTLAGQPHLAARSGRVHACWLQGDALLMNSSSDNGLSWSNAVGTVQSALGGPVSAPAICCEADRVFLSYVVAGNSVWVSRFSPIGSTVQHTQVESATTPSAQTRIACVGNYVFVAWREGDLGAGTARVQQSLSTNVGSTFAAAAGLGNGTANEDQVQLLHDGARLLFGWLDSRAASTGLFVNYTTQ